jgi:hypothetical protein
MRQPVVVAPPTTFSRCQRNLGSRMFVHASARDHRGLHAGSCLVYGSFWDTVLANALRPLLGSQLGNWQPISSVLSCTAVRGNVLREALLSVHARVLLSCTLCVMVNLCWTLACSRVTMAATSGS